MEGWFSLEVLLFFCRLEPPDLTGAPLKWRENLGLRGIKSLPIQFQSPLKLDRVVALRQLSTV
jgi:hypothetical protein